MSDIQQFNLQAIIDLLHDTKESLTGPLYRLKTFATLTKNTSLNEYCTKELKGYPVEDDDVPEYRKTPAQLTVTLQAGNQSFEQWFPISALPEPLNNKMQYVQLREPIATIENMSRDNSEGKQFGQILSMDMVTWLGPEIVKHFTAQNMFGRTRITMTAARVNGNPNVLHQVTSTVRTQLLEFVLEIADQFGVNISIPDFNNNQNENNKVIYQIMTTNNISTSGQGNVVNTGDNADITANISITAGDIDMLAEALRKYGIEEEDISELTEIVKTEKPDLKKNTLGPKTSGWIGKITTKALTGTGKILQSVASGVLVQLVKEHFGMH